MQALPGGRTATAAAEPSCAAEPFAAATAATAAAEPCAAEPSAAAAPPPPPPSPAVRRRAFRRRRALRRRALRRAEPFAGTQPRCQMLAALATRSTALAADLLKFDKANRKAAGPNTRRGQRFRPVLAPSPQARPRAALARNSP